MTDKLTFVFEFEHKKPILFKKSIEKCDYETFYVIVSNFFTDDLEEDDIEAILKVYPDINYDNNECVTIRSIFDNHSMIVMGVTSLSKNKYRIDWAT